MQPSHQTAKDPVGNIYSRSDFGSFVVIASNPEAGKLDVWRIENGDHGRILMVEFADGLRSGHVRFEAALSDLALCPRCGGTVRLVLAERRRRTLSRVRDMRLR
jgi:hypothetical protein